MEKIEELIKYKTQMIKQIDAFINGGSTTANKKSLSPHMGEALEYLVEQGVCELVMPEPVGELYEEMDENDKSGRYRLVESELFSLHRLRNLFHTELKQLLKG
jgi:hypothetical protein